LLKDILKATPNFSNAALKNYERRKKADEVTKTFEVDALM